MKRGLVISCLALLPLVSSAQAQRVNPAGLAGQATVDQLRRGGIQTDNPAAGVTAVGRPPGADFSCNNAAPMQNVPVSIENARNLFETNRLLSIALASFDLEAESEELTLDQQILNNTRKLAAEVNRRCPDGRC